MYTYPIANEMNILNVYIPHSREVCRTGRSSNPAGIATNVSILENVT